MKFKEFSKNTKRSNKKINDKLHFFSSKSSVLVSYYLYKIKLTPNQVTFLFGLMGVLAANFFIHNQFLMGYVFWRMHIIIDMADGNIARATQNFNQLAKSIDKIIHLLVNTLIFGALIILPSGQSGVIYLILTSILLIPFYLIYMLFNKITSLDSELSYDYKKVKKNQFIFIILRNLFTQEGLIMTTAILGIVRKNSFFGDDVNNSLLFIVMISYILFFNIGCILKLRILQKRTYQK